MTRRNPMNERYRDTEESGSKGKTRKSAASAKPVAKAGASVHAKAPLTPKERRKQEREKQRQADRRANSEPIVYTEKEKMWRKVWWGCFIAAVVCLAGSWLAQRLPEQYAATVMVGAMIFAYVFLALMIFVDIKFVRPARLRAREKGRRGLTKKERRDRERSAAAAEASRAANPSVIDRITNLLGLGKKDNK